MNYSLKVWLFTILVSPILVIAGMFIDHTGNLSDILYGLVIWLYAIFIGGFLALPALLLFRLLDIDLAKHEIPVYLKKIIYSLVGIVLL